MNGIAFQDKDEIWWLETIGGHHWIARKVPDDVYVVMPNQFGMDEFDLEDAYGEQKEFIDSLYEKVKQVQAETDPEKKDALLHEIRTDLNLRKNFSGEIDSFYARVETLHKDFTTRMTERFPQLTRQERRLAMLLRLGFSTKHMAALMNIAPASVEIGRHRLRSKFGLARGQNLTEFVKTI